MYVAKGLVKTLDFAKKTCKNKAGSSIGKQNYNYKQQNKIHWFFFYRVMSTHAHLLDGLFAQDAEQRRPES